MTIDSVPELARRVRHLETLVKRGKPADGSDNASLLKRISALESSVARIGKAAPTKPQVYTPKPAATVPKPANNSLAIKVSDHGALTGLADNDHPQYLLAASGKAADSDKLDGLDSTDFVKNSALGVWSDWTPTQTGWAAGYTVNVARYKLIGKTCFFTVDISGTSNSTAVNIVMPFTSYQGADNPVWGGTNSYVQNNGTVATTSASRWYIGENSATLIAHTNMSTGAWTSSGAKRIRVMGFYEIA